MALIVWHVQDAAAQPIAGALVQGDGDHLGHWQGVTNPCGDFFSDLGADHYTVAVSHPQYHTTVLPADLADCGIVTVGLAPLGVPPVPIPPIQPLHTDGPLFKTADGEPWRLQFVTAFQLPRRWLAGEDCKPFLDWTRIVGANGVRVFLRHVFLDWPAIHPFVMPPDRLRAFCDWCAAEGLYVEVTALCDCQAIYKDDAGIEHPNPIGLAPSEQVDYVEDVLEAVSGCINVLFSIGNEPHENAFDPVWIAKALDLSGGGQPLLSYGLYPTTGDEEDFPVLDFVGDHCPRKPDWVCDSGKIGHYQYVQCGVPCISEEPVKFAEPGADPEATEQSFETSPLHAEDAGGGYALSTAGAVFHCRSGIDTVPGGDLETQCAIRMFGAMRWISAVAPALIYTHDGLSDCPLAPSTALCELVGRYGDTEAWAAAAQPTEAWTPIAQGGWTITERGGSRGSLLRLMR